MSNIFLFHLKFIILILKLEFFDLLKNINVLKTWYTIKRFAESQNVTKTFTIYSKKKIKCNFFLNFVYSLGHK
jgi:hypothetical protein